MSYRFKKQLLWLIGWITADGTNFFEILVPFPFFPRFQIYARSGDLIRISKDNQEKKLSFLCHMASKQQSLRLIGWITADGTNFFEILVPFPFFPRFQIYSRLGDLIRISKDNQEWKKLSFLHQFDRKKNPTTYGNGSIFVFWKPDQITQPRIRFK